MLDSQACDAAIKEDCKLFFQCDKLGVMMTHAAKLRKEGLEYVKMDTKFTLDLLGMTPHEFQNPGFTC
jgi:hypothetical protein